MIKGARDELWALPSAGVWQADLEYRSPPVLHSDSSDTSNGMGAPNRSLRVSLAGDICGLGEAIRRTESPPENLVSQCPTQGSDF